jgi:hypothetical protein
MTAPPVGRAQAGTIISAFHGFGNREKDILV